MFDRWVWSSVAQVNTSSPAIEPRTAAPVSPVTPSAPTNNVPTASSAPGGTGATVAPGTTQPDAGKANPASFLWQVAPIILMFVVLYFILFRGQRKEEKRRKSAIAELKKGDKVMTIGGMVANVVSIDGEEVVLKIDESANVKARYRKTAIQEVLGGDEKK